MLKLSLRIDFANSPDFLVMESRVSRQLYDEDKEALSHVINQMLLAKALRDNPALVPKRARCMVLAPKPDPMEPFEILETIEVALPPAPAAPATA